MEVDIQLNDKDLQKAKITLIEEKDELKNYTIEDGRGFSYKRVKIPRGKFLIANFNPIKNGKE
jgi:hypothetical protein